MRLQDRSFIIELSGTGVERLTLEDRLSLLAYAAQITGRHVALDPDQVFLNFLNLYGKGDRPVPFTDKGASILEEITLPAAKPGSELFSLTSNEFVSSPQDFAALQLKRIRIGPLLGGSLEDFKQLTQAVRLHPLRKGIELYVVPSSKGVFAEALHRRYVHTIVDTGGRVGNLYGLPSYPPLAPNEFELTTELTPATDHSYLTSIQNILQIMRTGKVAKRG